MGVNPLTAPKNPNIEEGIEVGRRESSRDIPRILPTPTKRWAKHVTLDV